MVDGVCLFNGVWGRAFNVCAEQRLSPHIHKTYILSGAAAPDTRLPARFLCLCLPTLLPVPSAVSADVLLCRLMADYDVKCLWALISDIPNVWAVSYPHWPLLNGALMDAQWSPIRCNRDLQRLHADTRSQTRLTHQTHRQQISVCPFRHLNYCICAKIIREVENNRGKQALDRKCKAIVIEAQLV